MNLKWKHILIIMLAVLLIGALLTLGEALKKKIVTVIVFFIIANLFVLGA